MKQQLLGILLGLASVASQAGVRSESEFLVVYHEAAEEFKKVNLPVEAGVYIASPASVSNQRRDLLNLLEGAKWDNPFRDKMPIVAGYAPGTVPNTGNEVWAQYRGNFFLLRSQSNADQRVIQGVPKVIIPSAEGAFVASGGSKTAGQIAFIALPRNNTKVVPFDNIPTMDVFDRYALTPNSKNLIYFTKKGARDKSFKVVVLKKDGSHTVVADVTENNKGAPDVSIVNEGILFKSSATELKLLSLSEEGVKGAERVVFTARSGQTILFKDNTPILQANRAGGGRAFFYIRLDGSLSEVSVNRLSQTPLSADEHRLLNTYGADWGRRHEMGHFDEIIPRDQEVERIINVLKSQENTWVNIVGQDGVGKTELLKLVAKRIAIESKLSGEWNGFSVYQISMATLIALSKAPPPKPQPGQQPEPSPFEKLMGAITGKQVVVLIDDFLDDPALGPTNAQAAMDEFQKFFRANIENGQVRLVTTANTEMWSGLADSAPQLNRLGTRMNLPVASQEVLDAILGLQIRKFEKTFHVSFDPRVIAIIKSSAAELYPTMHEPKRTIRAAEDLARSVGSTAVNANTRTISIQDARSFFLRDVVQSRVLEKLDPEALRTFLKDRVFGQEEAVDMVVENLSALSLGVVDYQKPLTTLMLVGSTGTGKTYTADLLAEFLALPKVKIDMNFFNGFAGDSPQTREIKALSHRPFVLILDDIDKAPSKTVLAELRSVFDNGIYAQGTANELSLRNAIIVMTANYGAQLVLNNPTDSHDQLLAKIQAQVASAEGNKQPEIPTHVWSRIESSVVIYRALTTDVLTEVAKTFVKETDEDIFDRFQIHVVADDAFITNIVSKSVQRDLGAVPVQDLIRNKLKTQIALHLTGLRNRNSEQYARVREVFVTVNGAESMRIIDNTDPRYGRLRRTGP